MGRCKRQRSSFLKHAAVMLGVFLALCSLGIVCMAKFLIEPNLEAVARVRAEAVVSRTINEALAEEFAESGMGSDLIIIRKDEKGSLSTGLLSLFIGASSFWGHGVSIRAVSPSR